jgi:hypothetical protein
MHSQTRHTQAHDEPWRRSVHQPVSRPGANQTSTLQSIPIQRMREQTQTRAYTCTTQSPDRTKQTRSDLCNPLFKEGAQTSPGFPAPVARLGRAMRFSPYRSTSLRPCPVRPLFATLTRHARTSDASRHELGTRPTIEPSRPGMAPLKCPTSATRNACTNPKLES